MVNNNRKKLYNPNSFNALDAAVAFITVLVVFLVLETIMIKIVLDIRESVEEFDYYLYFCISALITQGAIFLVAFIWCKVRRVGLFTGGGFVCKFDFVKILFAIILCLGIYLTLYNAHLQFIEDIFPILYNRSYDDYTQAYNEMITGGVGYALIYIYVLSPLLSCICEELLFRGVIMRGLRQFGVTASVILSALCFTFMHGNVEQIVLQFALGLAMSAVVTLTKNYMIGIAMHFTHNLMTTLLGVFTASYGSFAYGGESFVDALFIILGVVFLIIGGYYFIKLAISEKVKEAKFAPKEISLKETENYAIVKKQGEDEQVLYPPQIDFNRINDGTYAYKKGGLWYRVNRRSKTALSIVFLVIGIVFSVVMIFTS